MNTVQVDCRLVDRGGDHCIDFTVERIPGCSCDRLICGQPVGGIQHPVGKMLHFNVRCLNHGECRQLFPAKPLPGVFNDFGYSVNQQFRLSGKFRMSFQHAEDDLRPDAGGIAHGKGNAGQSHKDGSYFFLEAMNWAFFSSSSRPTRSVSIGK